MIKNIENLNVKDKLVLLRIDINSPVLGQQILDNPRIKQASETIRFLLNGKAKLVILAHQGRKGDSDYTSLENHSILLTKYSGKRIRYLDFLFEDQSLKEIKSLKSGEAILLKNVRSYEDEKELKKSRFKEFSKLFDLYVNDAFSVSHRDVGSIIIPPKVIPSYIGLNFKIELDNLIKFKKTNKKSVYFIGGRKIEDYLPLFNNLRNKKNRIIASGVLANLMLIAIGKNLGYENKIVKEDEKKLLPKLKSIYKKYKSQIILPIDFGIGNPDINKAVRREISLDDFPVADKIWDVGSRSINLFKKEIKSADIVFMKGPLGFSEVKDYSLGTVEILKEISKKSNKNRFTLLGGGHLSTTAEKYKIPNNFSYISTSGGALIAYISGEELPGIKALDYKQKIKK